MNHSLQEPRSGVQGAPRSVHDAKRELLEWSVLADAELHASLTASMASAKQSAQRAIPWAAAGVAGIGLVLRLLGGGRAREKRGSMIGTVVRLGINLWPVWSGLLKRRDRAG